MWSSYRSACGSAGRGRYPRNLGDAAQCQEPGLSCQDQRLGRQPGLADPGLTRDEQNPTTLTAHSHIRNPFITSGVPGSFKGLFHTASFTWDGEIVLFTDEWAGGGGHGCDGPQDTRGNVWFYQNVPPGTPQVPLYGRYIIPRAGPSRSVVG